jgi:hypothetical protein
MPKLNPHTLDEGIREIVLVLRNAGYKTFTSCEGGRGHPFPVPTVGLRFEGDYFRFRDRLVEFLQSEGKWFFEIMLISSYHPKHPEGKHWVYLQGYDIASAEVRKKMNRTIKQKERRLIRQLERKGQLELVEDWLKKHRRPRAGRMLRLISDTIRQFGSVS